MNGSKSKFKQERSNGVRSLFSWAHEILKAHQSDRIKAKEIAIDGIEKFKEGKTSKEGKKLVKFLDNDCELVGFVPHIAYIKESARDKSELDSVWVHPFAQRTLLYKIKDSPALIMVNSSIELNDSALRTIGENHTIEDLLSIAGITG